ncbi:hypothetical protein FAD_1307 [Ferroplasma acidiphilum]|jgi:hypothetical protein|uniref:Uncharacterized protein n=1 Tax=Ferroplasma acidiphilum TaxID=74969 RepID=A0A1V0N4Y7_9ARCH|nr:hypothetical protein FAD_1307 [Ferroplasma acidiphilum]
MNIHIETFKNFPLKLRIIGYILLTDAFANFLTIFMIYTGKLPFKYMIITGINATVLGICAFFFAEYRIKKNMRNRNKP